MQLPLPGKLTVKDLGDVRQKPKIHPDTVLEVLPPFASKQRWVLRAYGATGKTPLASTEAQYHSLAAFSAISLRDMWCGGAGALRRWDFFAKSPSPSSKISVIGERRTLSRGRQACVVNICAQYVGTFILIDTSYHITQRRATGPQWIGCILWVH